MAEMYSDFARVYDELMDETPYGEWCETLVQFIQKYGVSEPVRAQSDVPRGAFSRAGEDTLIRDTSIRVEEEIVSQDGLTKTRETGKTEETAQRLASERDLVVDLGCGTGTFTELLYQRGYDMIGVDNAPDMLEIAMEKREKSGSEILYLQQDMRELELYSTVGTVISVCDSVNYILEEDELLEVFRRVNNYLYPGGLFIFDFNTDYKYREVIGDTTIAENREDCSFIWENYYDEESALNEYDVTIFVQEDGELFRRFTETHVQRGYDVERMKKLLTDAGLELLEVQDADMHGEVTGKSERVYMVAREHGKLL